METRAEFLEEIDGILARLRRVLVALVNDKVPAARIADVPKEVVQTLPKLQLKPRDPAPVRVQRPVQPGVRFNPGRSGRRVTADERPDETIKGVTVSFAEWTVFYKDKRAKLTNLRQAELVATLAKAMPDLIPTGDMLQRAWPDLALGSRDSILWSERHRLNETLNEVGLRLYHERKFGFALKEMV